MDHFKFYNATGNPVNVIVDLLDQFHQEPNVPVLQPRYFGNPVEKTHNGVVTPITHPNDYLVCYDIAPQPFNTTVTTLNQFGAGDSGDPACRPSLRAQPEAGFRVATPTPTSGYPQPRQPTATATATATIAPTPTATPPVLDHFKAYITDGQPVNQTGAPARPVQPSGGAARGKGGRSALPLRQSSAEDPRTRAPVITPITNPDTHLEMYYLLPRRNRRRQGMCR